MPTLILSAEDEEGHDVVDVQVTLDGAPLAARLDGKAVEVDPGEHVLRFERAGSDPVELPLVVREGEKLRRVSTRIVRRAAQGGGAPREDAAASTSAGLPILPIALGTVAVAGGVAYAAFGLSARADADHLRSTCAPRCAEADVDAREQLGRRTAALGDGAAQELSGAAARLVARPVHVTPVRREAAHELGLARREREERGRARRAALDRALPDAVLGDPDDEPLGHREQARRWRERHEVLHRVRRGIEPADAVARAARPHDVGPDRGERGRRAGRLGRGDDARAAAAVRRCAAPGLFRCIGVGLVLGPAAQAVEIDVATMQQREEGQRGPPLTCDPRPAAHLAPLSCWARPGRARRCGCRGRACRTP